MTVIFFRLTEKARNEDRRRPTICHLTGASCDFSYHSSGSWFNGCALPCACVYFYFLSSSTSKFFSSSVLQMFSTIDGRQQTDQTSYEIYLVSFGLECVNLLSLFFFSFYPPVVLSWAYICAIGLFFRRIVFFYHHFISTIIVLDFHQR